MKIAKSNLLASFIALVSTFNAMSQSNISLNIFTDDGEPFKKGELIVSRNDSTVLFEIVETPQHTVQLQEQGRYMLSFTSPGYNPFERIIPDTAYMQMDVLLERAGSTLGEVVVKGYSQSEKTATGEIFKLSSKAKNSKNPFKALSEIPLLKVDVATQDVKLRDGSSALILIDGKMVNTGIAPIDPKFIETVEISEVVSARYMNMGITKIIDIKLKREVPMYLYADVRTRHDIPVREGFGGANFEAGTKKFAIYGSVFDEYLYKDKTEYSSEEILGDVSKVKDGTNKNWSNSIKADITLKWVPKTSNYFAARFMGRYLHTKMKGDATGHYDSARSYDLTSVSDGKTTAKPFYSALYYEHTFGDNSTLSTFGSYQRSWGTSKDSNEEKIAETVAEYTNFQKTIFEMYSFQIDYNGARKKFGSINVGNEFNLTSNRLRNHNTNPIEKAKVRHWNNYTYLTYNNMWKKLYYMASAGVQCMNIDADGKRHSYWRPKVSASLALVLPKGNMIRGNYYLQNMNPSVTYLFVFNNSTDPWMRYEGNPYLKPVMKHSFNLSYDKQIGMHYIRLNALHVRTNHMIESCMKNEGDYMISSFRNNGTYNGTILTPSYTGFIGNVQASVSPSVTWEQFKGQPMKSSYGVSGYVRWDVGKFLFYGTFGWKNKTYDAISVVKYHNPTEAQINVFWQATEQLSIALGMPYVWGVRSQTATLSQNGYISKVKTKYKGASLHPWILISWTIYKNEDQSIQDKISRLGGNI